MKAILAAGLLLLPVLSRAQAVSGGVPAPLTNSLSESTVTISGTGNACFSAGGLVIDCANPAFTVASGSATFASTVTITGTGPAALKVGGLRVDGNTNASTFVAGSSVTISSVASIGALAVTYGVTAGSGTFTSSVTVSGAAAAPLLTTRNGLLSLESPPNANIDLGFGVYPTSPFAAWVQSANIGGAAFPLALQPLGGFIGINNFNPGSRLHMSSGTLTCDGNTCAITSTGPYTGTGPNGNVISASSITTTGAVYGAWAGFGTGTTISTFSTAGVLTMGTAANLGKIINVWKNGNRIAGLGNDSGTDGLRIFGPGDNVKAIAFGSMAVADGTTFTPAITITGHTSANPDNVGIGTSNPLTMLEVNGVATFNTNTATTTAGGIVYTNYTSSSTGAGIGAHTLMTYTLPANAVASAGRTLHIMAWGTTASNGNNKTISLTLGANTAFTTGVQTTSGGNWYAEGTIIRGGSSTASTGVTWGSCTAALTTSPFSPIWQNLNNDWTASVVISVVGTDGSASAGDILAKGMLVELK